MANVLAQIGSKIASFFGASRQPIGKMWQMSTPAVYPNPTVENAVNKGFKTNTAVYSIVKKAAKKFGTIPREVEIESEDGEEESYQGKLTDLINRPNPNQGQDAFFALVYAFYKVCGESFIWLNRGEDPPQTDEEMADDSNKNVEVLEMHVIAANKITIIPDPDDPFSPIGYQLTERPDIKFRRSDIIHWKDINLDWDIATRSQLRGYSPLTAGYKTLEANNSATDATVRMNQNSGSKGALVNKIGGQNPMQQSQVEKILDTKVNNIDVKGAVSAFQGDWSYLNFGLTSVDMELLKGKQLTMQELCFLMGMPYEFFDSQVTYANRSEAQKGWVINEIMPDCCQLDGEMNRVLLPAFNLSGKVKICCDFDNMQELQEDKKAQIEWMMKGPYSPDEIREATGYEKLPDGEGDKVIIPSGYVALSDLEGDGGNQLLQTLYNANGSANRVNGNGQVPKNGKGADVQAGKGAAKATS